MQAKSGSIAEIVTKTKETAEKAAQQQAEIKKNAKASKVNIKELAPSAGKWSVDPKIDMDTLTTKQTAAVSYLKAVSEVSGMNITLMSGVDVTGAFSVENGHYDGVINTLYVSVNAGMQSITDITGSAILKTASHEITHYIAASGTQTYSLLEDYVLSRFTEQYGEKSVDNRIEDIQEQYKDQVGKELTREQAKEEMVAAACEMMLKNSEVFEKLARQNLTLAQRIKAGLDGFIKKLSANRKAAFENLDATSPEARAIAASETSLKETQKLWDNALRGAIKENEGGKSAGTGSMYELRGYSEKEVNNWANSKRIIIYRDNIQLKEFVNEALNNKNYDRKMYFGKIPANLAEDIKNILSADIDVEGYNCTLDSYHIRKINAKHGNEVNERLLGQRGVTVNDYETIPSVISNPDSLTDQGLYNGKPAIGFVKYINGEKFTVIGVISDKHMDLFVQTSYIGAKKGSLATRASEKTDTITPEAHRGTAPDNNIADSADAVNTLSPDIRYELRDNQGRELTKTQAEKFKDSQVRDKDGRLKTVYHGSSAVFNVFSADFMSQHGSSEGQGFYFTDYKDMAEGYQKKGGQLLEGYLNITNPLSDSEVTLSAPEVKRLLKALDPTGDDVILNYDSQGGMGYPSKAWYNRALADTVNSIMSTSESDSEILAEIANAGAGSGNVMDAVRKVLGYDGYIVEGKYDNANVYVAFGSDQFKSFDNKTPTSSPDIHLELRSDENQFNPRKELSNLFMQIAQNEQETKSLRSYQAAIHELNNTEIEISKLQQEMQSTDKLKSPQKYYELQNKLRQAEAKLNRYDGRLVQLEATKPMKDLIARREQRLKEQFARSSTTRAKYRNNIKKNIRSLDKKLRTNSGQKHVLLELQPVVAQLLNVFTENTSVFKKEQLAKLREIYAKFNPEADSKMQATDNDVKRWKSTAEYSSAYSEMIYDLIEEVRPLVQGKRLIDLDTELLAAVNDIVSNIKQKSAVSKSLPRRRFSVVDQSEHFTAKPPLKK